MMDFRNWIYRNCNYIGYSCGILTDCDEFSGLVQISWHSSVLLWLLQMMLSLLASFTIIPWLSSRFGKLVHLTGKNYFEKFILWFEKQLEKFHTHWISGILEWCLKTTKRIMTVI